MTTYPTPEEKRNDNIKLLILLAVIVILLLVMSLQGCVSTKQHARNLVRKGWKKVEKGLEMDPTLADSIYQKKTVLIEIPRYRDSISIKPLLDTARFQFTINNYDSLLRSADSLARDLEYQGLQGEELENRLAVLRNINEQLLRARNEFLHGFAVDSVYTYEDSVQIAYIHIKEGQLYAYTYETKPQKVSKDVNTTTVNLDGSRRLGIWPLIKKFWWVGLLLLIILILALRKILLP